GANPMLIKRGIDKAVEAAVAEIKKRAIELKGKEDIAHVASIAANDREIGQLVADAMDKVGKDGVLTVEEAKGTTTQVEVVEGMEFDRGYISPYFVTNAEAMEAVLEEPFILIHEKKISNVHDLLPLLEQVVQAGRPLLIIAEAVGSRVVSRLRAMLNVVAVKAPGFGEGLKAMLEDIEILTGGQFISEDLGTWLENVTLDMLGEARRVRVTKEETTIVEGRGDKKAVQGRIELIKRQIEETDSDYDREKLQERLAKLAGGVAVIQVGAATETELKEKKHRVEDAVNATRAAVEEGIVPGGGTTLVNIIPALDKVQAEGDEAVGVNIV